MVLRRSTGVFETEESIVALFIIGFAARYICKPLGERRPDNEGPPQNMKSSPFIYGAVNEKALSFAFQ